MCILPKKRFDDPKCVYLCKFFPSVFFFTADSTGTHSLYTRYQDYEIMFHVSTMLPYTANNTQQVKTTQTKMNNKENHPNRSIVSQIMRK